MQGGVLVPQPRTPGSGTLQRKPSSPTSWAAGGLGGSPARRPGLTCLPRALTHLCWPTSPREGQCHGGRLGHSGDGWIPRLSGICGMQWERGQILPAGGSLVRPPSPAVASGLVLGDQARKLLPRATVCGRGEAS